MIIAPEKAPANDLKAKDLISFIAVLGLTTGLLVASFLAIGFG